METNQSRVEPVESEEVAERCATVARRLGIDPIGTAGACAGLLLVEWPLPWPRDAGDVPALREVTAAALHADVKLRLIAPVARGGGRRHVILYTREAGSAFRRFECREVLVAPEDVVDAAKAALSQDVAPATEQHHDVFICTHGSRDACCGSLGTKLAMALHSSDLGASERVWRSSHTGGHRFAPTATLMPEGTVWAAMDVLALQSLLAREGDLSSLLPRYRGSLALHPPPLQVLERLAFGYIGWEWLDWHRGGAVTGNRATLHGSSSDGAEVVWEGMIAVERENPVPECGAPLSASIKSEAEFRIDAWHMTQPRDRRLAGR